jgi:hypothetical protein
MLSQLICSAFDRQNPAAGIVSSNRHASSTGGETMNAKLLGGLAIVLLGASAGCRSAVAPDMSEAGDSFSGVSLLIIRAAQGETRIERSDNDQVSVQYDYTYPESCHQPRLILTGNTLEVRGIFEPVACSGRAEISIWVPDGVVIDFIGGQADLVLDGVAVQIDAIASSIEARRLVLTGESSLFANDEDVFVSFGEMPTVDFHAWAGPGNVTIDAEGHALRGRFEFAVNEEHGMIVSPYLFDDVVRYDCQCEPGVTWWVRKVFTRYSTDPTIKLSTRGGVAGLRLD